MNKGVCPRCGSKEVHSGAKVGWKSGMNQCNTIPIGALSTATLDNYVCVKCGYVESYINNPKTLAKIARKWPLASDLA